MTKILISTSLKKKTTVIEKRSTYKACLHERRGKNKTGEPGARPTKEKMKHTRPSGQIAKKDFPFQIKTPHFHGADVNIWPNSAGSTYKSKCHASVDLMQR